MCSSSELVRILNALATQFHSQYFSTLVGVFIFSVVTSVHCLIMCGPLGCIAVDHLKQKRKTLGFSIYNLARISSYTIVGAIFGHFGNLALKQYGFFSLASLGGIAFVLFCGILINDYISKRSFDCHLVKLDKISSKSNSLSRPIVIGFLSPLAPGLISAPMFLLASGTGSAWKGATFLFVFGVGSLPAIFLVFLAGKKVLFIFSNKLKIALSSIMYAGAFILLTYRFTF